MADLLSRRPFNSIMDDFEKYVRSTHGHPVVFRAGEGFWHPPVDIHLTPSSVVARIDIPGVDIDEVKITTEENTLTVRGSRPPCEEVIKEERCWHNETARGDFHRVIDLPEHVDREKVSADYENGVLTITMPKKPELAARAVEIRKK